MLESWQRKGHGLSQQYALAHLQAKSLEAHLRRQDYQIQAAMIRLRTLYQHKTFSLELKHVSLD